MGKVKKFQPLLPGRLAVINAQKSAGQYDPPPRAERVKATEIGFIYGKTDEILLFVLSERTRRDAWLPRYKKNGLVHQFLEMQFIDRSKMFSYGLYIKISLSLLKR